MFEKIKSLDLFTKILLVVCGIFMVSSITLGIIAVTRTGNSKNDETPVLTTQVETTATTTETTTTETTATTTVTTTTTTEETTATETTTTAPAKTTAAAPKKTTTAPVEKPVSKPKTTAPEEKLNYYIGSNIEDNYNYGRKIYYEPITMYMNPPKGELGFVYYCPDFNSDTCAILDPGTKLFVYSEKDGWVYMESELMSTYTGRPIGGHIPADWLSKEPVEYHPLG